MSSEPPDGESDDDMEQTKNSGLSDDESPVTEEPETAEAKEETEESSSDLEDPIADPSLQAGLAEASLSSANTAPIYEYEYESNTFAQAPKLEVIAEHEILETPAPATALASPGTGDPADQEVANYLLDGQLQKPVFAVDDWDERSLTPLSRHDSYSMSYSRQDSLAGYNNGPQEQDSSHPLLRPIARHQLSEPTLPKSYSESHSLGWLKHVGHFVGRVFGSTAVTPSDSLQSLEFGPPVNFLDPTTGQRVLRRPYSSRNSVSSDIALPITSRASSVKGFSSRNHQHSRITGPGGQPISRSRRFMMRGTAGFLHAKGTSAISLRPPEPSQGLPSPCGECPHCRKFMKMGDVIHILPLGRACPCRICMIICEGQPGGPTLLKLQAASRRNKEPGGVEPSTDRSQPQSQTHFPSDFGIFCEHCNQSAFDGRCIKLLSNASSSGPPVQPTVVIQSSSANATTSPNDIQSEATSVESLFGRTNSRDQAVQVSHMSLCSSISNLSAPFCRICHGTSNGDEALMSPCRCAGSLKCVHQSCLVHWLEISCRKLRKPPVCELCGYRYQRHKIFRFGNMAFPSVSSRDKFYHIVFVLGILTMFISAGATIVCFQMEKDQSYNRGGLEVELNAIEVVTLIAGVMFFVGFFVAMYVEVKAQTTLYKLINQCWALNQEWRIEEYNLQRDQAYTKKLQAARQKFSSASAYNDPHRIAGFEDDISDRSFNMGRSGSFSALSNAGDADVECQESVPSRKVSDTVSNGVVAAPV